MFVRGGNVGPGDYLVSAGYAGYYWSSVSYGSHSAYRLSFTLGYVAPSNYGYQHFGFSLRCVALGGRTHYKISTKRIVLVF